MSTLTDSHGQLVDEKMKEFEEDDEYESTNVEIWEKEPQKLLEEETNRMRDFYKSVKPLISHKTSSSPASAIFTNATEQSTKSSSKIFQTKEDQRVPAADYENYHYENIAANNRNNNYSNFY